MLVGNALVAILSSSSIRAERARRDFKLFVVDAWHELEPGTPLLWNWHLDALCEHLQALQERKITRLVIGIGPGHAKSTIVSQMFPDWVWLNNPYSRWLCASHSLDLAIRDNRYRRRLIESEWFQARYSHIFKFAPDQKMKSYYENDKKGYMMAVAVRGSGTGKRASHLLIDDANNAMAGQADLAATVEWYGKMWVSRQNDQEHGMSVVVGQRLGSKDLIGHILELGGCEHLCLPEEFETARRCTTSIGWTDPRTVEGELLWPAKFPIPVLDKLKATLGSLDYAAQYQQNPVPAGGAVFKEKWFRYLSIDNDQYALETPEGTRHVAIKDCWRFTVVDLAVSTKQSADWTVIQTYDVTPQNELLLIDQIRGHFDNPTQQKLIRLTYFRLKPQFVQIEAIAYQLALIQQLRDEPIESASLVPSPIKEGDFLVRTNSAAALDQTLQLLDVPTMKATVVKDEQDNYAQHDGCAVVRVQGDFYFFKYMCEQQGYCTPVRDVRADDITRIEQETKRKYSIPIQEYRPVRDKVSRASAPAILMENGKFYFLKTLQDLHIIRTEHLLFPKGGNDDIVDCSAQAAEVVTVPRGPMMWSIDEPDSVRSPEKAPATGIVSSIFEQHVSDFEDEGELFDFEIGGR
ncbi:hypothetical protein ccbrp13_56480 [Ktedonobacteria bacterium brp13]|nr:hypothetical protein ccbrp13_56480 [Ktedonobacteria bacterium brp13]